MDFGVREVANVVLKAIEDIPANKSITGEAIDKGQPVMYFDTLKVSTLTGAVSTVYATGGQGNPRLLAWDSDKEITFNMEDALISPESFALLSGGVAKSNELTHVGTGSATAGDLDLDTDLTPVFDNSVLDSADDIIEIMVEVTTGVGLTTGDVLFLDIDANYVFATNVISIPGATTDTVKVTIRYKDPALKIKVHKKEIVTVSSNAATLSKNVFTNTSYPVFAFRVDEFGNIDGGLVDVTATNGTPNLTNIALPDGTRILVDYYTEVQAENTIVVEANRFPGFFRMEADTLWRRESDGQDVTAQLVIPKLKIKSNFELTMEATGDPSTFSFEADAFKVNVDNKQVMFELDILGEDVNA